jgi:hypothetical protein
MNNKQTIVITSIVIAVACILFIVYTLDRSNTAVTSPLPVEMPGDADRRIAEPTDTPPTTQGKLKADVFSGTLEAVDTGCFADGECFVEVGGKHVTTLRGWSRDTVGTIQGVPGFGDLEQYLGTQVEVYAQVLEDGTYTLYGSEGFYIKPLSITKDDGGTREAPTPPVASTGCVVGGCSSQLCLDASATDGVSTCEWREEYGCYRSATCERQNDGSCGWTITPELSACLKNASASAL